MEVPWPCNMSTLNRRYCCTLARHMLWSPSTAWPWDMGDKGNNALLVLGNQFLPHTPTSSMWWQLSGLGTWKGSVLADGHWCLQTQQCPGYQGCLASKPCKQQPCCGPLSPLSQPAPAIIAATRKSCGVYDRGRNMSQIFQSLQSSVPHKNHVGYSGEGRIFQVFDTGNLMETEIQQLLYQMEHWASTSKPMLVLMYCL